MKNYLRKDIISAEEKDLRARINSTYLGLEIRITIDHFLNPTGAKLVSPKGRSIDVHPDTVKIYEELQSLIFNYTTAYGTNPSLEELRNKWATPEREGDIAVNYFIIYFSS